MFCCFKKKIRPYKHTEKELDLIYSLQLIYGDLYDYSNIQYKKHHKIELICKKHGSFKKLISSHLIGSGCPLCSKEDRLKNVLKYYKL